MNFIQNNFPDPVGAIDWSIDSEGNTHEFVITEEGPGSALVFKTTIDQFSGKLSFIKVLRGTIKGDTDLTIRRPASANVRARCIAWSERS